MSAASKRTTSASNIISENKLVRLIQPYKKLNELAFILGSRCYLASFLWTNNVQQRKLYDLPSTNENNCPGLPRPKVLENEGENLGKVDGNIIQVCKVQMMPVA
jgi:hypothetical protein